MTAESNSKARGTIVKVPDATPGLLFVQGQQKIFVMEGVWKAPVAPAANMTVDVELDATGAVAAITPVDTHQMSKEKLNQLGGVAQEQGKQAAKLAQQGVGALAARMGTMALVLVVVIWITWFFLPAIKIDLGFAGAQSFTFWQYLGFDTNDPSTLAEGGASHGFFSLLALLCIAAPFAAPFVPHPRAKLLNALPLIGIVIGIIAEHMSISHVAGALGGDVSSIFSMSFGIYVLVLASLVLAVPALMSLKAS